MKFICSIILCLICTPAITAQKVDRPVNCKVTGINKGVVTLRCVKTTLDIPQEHWPEQWAGRCEKGSNFPAQWISGHLVPVADAQRLIQEMTREGKDYERLPVNH